MSKRVVVVESPEKAMTLAAQFDGEVETLVVETAPARATLIPAKEPLRRGAARFTFAADTGTEGFLDQLRARQGQDIYLALDGDWRGEYWAWLLNGYWESVSQGGRQFHRLDLLGLAGETLAESFRLVTPVRAEQGGAVQVRLTFEMALGRHLQRLLGTRSGPNDLPITSLALASLALLSERETEIRLYSPIPCWRLKARVATSAGGEAVLTLEEAYGITDDALLRNDREVKGAIALFNHEDFVVREVELTPFTMPPPLPYGLAELLHDAVVLAGLAPLDAFAALRSLYYGVEVNGRRTGLLTAFFPVPGGDLGGVLARVRQQAAAVCGPGNLGQGDIQEMAAMAGLLLPILPEITPDSLRGKVSGAEESVYRLVWSRALASQLKDAEGEAVRVTVEAGSKCRFVGTASRATAPGFLSLYQGCAARELLAPSPLAKTRQGEQLRCMQILPEKHAGHPPEYHGFASLAADLGELAMEFDGALVTLLQQMLDKGYLKMMPDGSFRCAENSAKLLAVMGRAFPSMKGINFSAYLAQCIDEVVNARKPLHVAMQQFEQTLMMRGEVLVKVAMPVSVRKRGISSRSIIRTPEAPVAQPTVPQTAGSQQPEAVVAPQAEESLPSPGMGAGPEPSVEAAESAATEAALPPPLEGGALGEQEAAVPEAPGAEEEFALASEETVADEMATPEESPPELSEAVARMFAEATEDIVPTETLKSMPEQPEAATEETEDAAKVVAGAPARECPECGRPLLLKQDRFGKFWYCSGHPECRHSESYGKEGGEGGAMVCPLCQIGNVVSKQTPTGKPFYVCPEAECEFMSWSRPHPTPCRVCGSPYLVEKRTLAGATVLHCPKAGCGYSQPLSGVAGEGVPQPRKKVVVRRVARPGGAPAGSGGATRKVRVVRRKG
ncbi:MAG: DNA topoisomerase [Thermodesulfobacteriota bacterium]